MVATDLSILPLHCAKCSTEERSVPLFHIARPKAYDRVYCVVCGGVGEYKQVVEGSAGLIGGVLAPEEILDLREQVRVSIEQGRNKSQ